MTHEKQPTQSRLSEFGDKIVIVLVTAAIVLFAVYAYDRAEEHDTHVKETAESVFEHFWEESTPQERADFCFTRELVGDEALISIMVEATDIEDMDAREQIREALEDKIEEKCE